MLPWVGYFVAFKNAFAMQRTLSLLIAVLFYTLSWGQPGLYQPRNLSAAQARGTRTLSGAPGPNYWQNRADYSLKMSIQPPDRRIQGSAVIRYTNNSPDTLHVLNFKLAQNTHLGTSQRPFDVESTFLTSGMQILSLRIGGQPVAWDNQEVNYSGDATNHFVDLPQPLAPGSQAEIAISWTYELNTATDNVREGVVDPTTFFLAYFFPRISVYDDLDGWDRTSLNEQTEFYNDFGTFDLEVEVPKGFVVWATGDLLNAREVLQGPVLRRLQESQRSPSTVRIVTEADLRNKAVTQNTRRLVYRFRAENVTDVALGVSDHYLWDGLSAQRNSSATERVWVQTAYSSSSLDYPGLAEQARQTVEYFATQMPGYPFPYPKLTVFEGYSMMEYPMMVNDVSLDNPDDVIALVTHEIAHQYLPFMMGTNESKFAWMDEGWATFLEYHASLDAFTLRNPKAATFPGYYQRQVPYNGTPDIDLPLYTPTDQLFPEAYGFNSYGKPAAAYTALKMLLGEDLFKKCLHGYFERWQGKHPSPHDFFYSFSDLAEEDLTWFWQRWFFQYNRVDLTVQSATQSGETLRVEVVNNGGKPVPVFLQITYADGSQSMVEEPLRIWQNTDRYSLHVVAPKVVKEVRLLDDWFFDANRSDNGRSVTQQ
ncbi:MAG: M1 family metallopeptidase [Lewinellaceae bacterium]|nr:M1 family metallopeptidase [Lewinellaceae bacterium]